MVNSIPQAVAVLLYKNMHLPIEDDEEFAGETEKKASPENAMMAQMLTMMQQTQNLLLQQQERMIRSPRSPRQSSYVAATYEDQVVPRASQNGRGPQNGGNSALNSVEAFDRALMSTLRKG